MKYVLYAIVDSPGGTAQASAKLNSQHELVLTLTAFARTLIGKISAGYVQLTGPIVIANEHTNKYEQTMIPFVAESWPWRSHTGVSDPDTVPHCPKRPWRPPTSMRKNPISAVPARSIGLRPHLSM